MGVVAVRAPDAHPEHLALDERAVLEVLLEDLSVRVVDALGEQDGQVVVEELRPAVVVVAQLRAARVARGAELDELAVRDPRRLHDEAGVLEPGPAHRRHLRPRHVSRAGAVAGLAAHVDLRPRGPVGVGLRVVPLDQVRGVALGAHAVPVLAVARPVEPVRSRDPLARVEEEPPLPRDVPRQRERLHPPARKADQVLLQGIPAEGVGHLEHRRLPVRSLRSR